MNRHKHLRYAQFHLNVNNVCFIRRWHQGIDRRQQDTFSLEPFKSLRIRCTFKVTTWSFNAFYKYINFKVKPLEDLVYERSSFFFLMSHFSWSCRTTSLSFNIFHFSSWKQIKCFVSKAVTSWNYINNMCFWFYF